MFTIIVKSVGKAAIFYLLFSRLSPAPGPMLSKTLMFVPVIVLLYSNIKYAGGRGGGREIFSKRERKTLFWGLKWTTVKFYNLPNYFCLGLYLTVFWRCPSSESDVNVSNDPGKVERSFFGFAAMYSPHIGMFSF